MSSEPTRYVYNGSEVKLTGQTAERKLAGGRRGRSERVDTIYEITPANDEDGSWKKWVHLRELYEITNGETNSYD